MEAWQRVWRDGFAPLLTVAELSALKSGLETDDERLIQEATTQPPPLASCAEFPIEGGCALCYSVWVASERVMTVGEVEERFASLCFEADQLLGEPAACRHFLNWFDRAPRRDMRRLLLEEVERALEPALV